MEYLSHIQSFSQNQSAGDYASLTLADSNLSNYYNGVTDISTRMTEKSADAQSKSSVDQNAINTQLDTKISDMNASYLASVNERIRDEAGMEGAALGIEILKKSGKAVANAYRNSKAQKLDETTEGETPADVTETNERLMGETEGEGVEMGETSAIQSADTGYAGSAADVTAVDEGGRLGQSATEAIRGDADSLRPTAVEEGNPIYEMAERNEGREADVRGMRGEDVDVGGGGVETSPERMPVEEGEMPTSELSSGTAGEAGGEAAGESAMDAIFTGDMADVGATGMMEAAGEVALAGGGGLDVAADVVAGGLFVTGLVMTGMDMFGGSKKREHKEKKKEQKKQDQAEADSQAAEKAYQDKIGQSRAEARTSQNSARKTYNDISSKLAQSNHSGVTIGVSAGARNY